jgi:phytoene synthase
MPGLSPLAALVRRHDRDRYQTVLFAPADRREALFALYAFNYEIARVRETVSQPMLGQIRLQWWREIVAAAFAGAPPRQHEIAEPLTAFIGGLALTRAHFDRMIDTRERDLADAPPATLAALEDYAEGSSATLLYLALEVLGVAEPAAHAAASEVGTLYALAGLLRAMPFHAGAGRCYIPADIAARARLDRGAGRSRRRSFTGGAAISSRNSPIGARRDVACRRRGPLPHPAEAGGLQPVRARIGHPRPAAELAPLRRRPAQPVLMKPQSPE